MNRTFEILFILSVIFIFSYLPVATLGVGALIRNRLRKSDSCPAPVPGRRVLMLLTTNGENPDVARRIVAEVRSFGLPVEFAVLVEASDSNEYGARKVVIPASFETPRRSIKKLRAQHYGSLWLREHGYGSETYVIHLDDDSIPSREYVQHVFGMREEAGQGVVRLRAVGYSWLSTLADSIRVTACDSLCQTFNRAGKPVFAHGEGLVLRADVESELGWDFAVYGGEDMLMAIRVSKRYRWGFIPHPVYISPPTTAVDFYRQRRRWHASFFSAAPSVVRERWWGAAVIIYFYYVGWTGIVGLVLWLANLALGVPFPPWLIGVSLFCLLSYFGLYAYGAGQAKRRYIPLMILAQYPVALYEGLTLPYTLVRPPPRDGYEVIKKV